MYKCVLFDRNCERMQNGNEKGVWHKKIVENNSLTKPLLIMFSFLKGRSQILTGDHPIPHSLLSCNEDLKHQWMAESMD